MSQSEHTERQQQPERRAVDIRQYLWVIRRRKWIILLAFLVTTAGTAFYLIRATPMYRTSVKILIGEEKGELSMFKELGFLGQMKLAEEMETYCELLRTHQLISQVVEKTKLHELAEKQSDSNSFLSRLRQLVRFDGDNAADQVEVSEELRIRRATEQLQDMIEVETIRDTRIIKVTVSGTEPELTTDIANEMANAFITYNLQSMKGEAKSAYDFISDQLNLVREKLRTAEDNLRSFKEKEGVVELTEEAKITLERHSSIEASYNTSIAGRQEAEARRDATRRELETHDATIKSSTTVGDNPLVQVLKGQLYDFETEMAGLLKVYPADAPEVDQIKTKITQTQERLAKEVEKIVTAEVSSINPVHQALVSRLIQLEADVIAYDAMAEAQKTFAEQYKVELDQLPSKELDLARLTRDKNVSDQTYMMLIARKEEAQLAQAIQIGNISIADPAITPLRSYNSSKRLTLMLGAALGLMLGVGFAFFLERIDNTFRTEEDVKRYLELPLLGSVPIIANQRKSAAKPFSKLPEQESRMLTHFSHRAPGSEAYRMLNTSIQFGEIDNPVRTLLITSSAPGEGKTLTVANLGITMAQSGKRVLLVDADMRKPTLHRLFRLERQPGLTDFFLGEATMQDIIRNTPINNLSIITAGATPPNAPQLLASQKMKDTIEELKGQFDIIMFDSSPVTVVTDPAILGSNLDAVCLVVEAEGTIRDVALKAKEILTNVDANLFGVILNKVDVRKGYGYYYYYDYYYHDDDRENGRGEKRKRRRK